jgi:rod shape-determining protein MreD
MRRVLLSVVLLLLALVLQLTVLDRLPLPGGVAPDLVLLVVVALALSSGPVAGMLGGFCAGLALDIAPPSDHLIGAYALVFCLVGYCCGLVSAELDSTVLLPLAASALGAAGGAALYAAVGVILGNPDVTGSAVRHVLPVSVLYDVLLSPFVLYGVALASRLSARLAGAAAASGASLAGPQAGPRSPARQGGRTPRLRAAAARPRDGWIGGGWLAASAELARRPPSTVRLHLGGQRTAAAPARTGTAGRVPRMRFGAGRRGDAVLGSRLLGGGFFSELSNGGSRMPGPAGGRRLFTRRSRRSRGGSSSTAGAGWARFIRRPAWGYRGTGGTGSAPRRGSFGASTPRQGPGSAASPRRRTFRAAATPRRRTLSSGSPRRGAFSGGSSTRGSLGSGSPRRGAFGGGPRRLRTLRKATLRGGGLGRGRSTLGRVRGGRLSAWRTGHKRSGGYR